jgi:uncharacterized LabA/DUF88 family protein
MGNSVYVFIDASNLWQAQKAARKLFDYAKLVRYLRRRFVANELVVYYYTAYPAEGTREYSLDGKHKFFTFLEKGLGMVVRKKELKQIRVSAPTGVRIEEKGNMDVELTIDAVDLVNNYNVAILFTGDSDFLPLVEYIRGKGKRAYVFSSRNNVSSELRTGADGYYDVLKIDADIWRTVTSMK